MQDAPGDQHQPQRMYNQCGQRLRQLECQQDQKCNRYMLTKISVHTDDALQLGLISSPQTDLKAAPQGYDLKGKRQQQQSRQSGIK